MGSVYIRSSCTWFACYVISLNVYVSLLLINFFFQVNRLAYTIPKPENNARHFEGNRTRVIFSHLPLLFMPSAFVQQVMLSL
jgi:hypothetical protein